MKTPHKHCELIKAWADGALIEARQGSTTTWVTVKMPMWDGHEYRIKPEPKPDVVRYGTVWHASHNWGCDVAEDDDNLKLTFDGETGKLKSAEVIS